MNTFFAIAVGGVMLVLVGRSLFKLIKDTQGLDARNRRLAVLTVIAIMLGFVARVIIVHYERVG